MAQVSELKSDGRRARSEKTRAAIVDAMMELISEGRLTPTSEDVAARAGVGHRTVFRHFEDMDSLFREISDRVEGMIAQHMKRIDLEAPLEARVEAMVAMRAGAYEKIKNFRRSAVARQGSSAFIQENRMKWAQFMRERLAQTLPELDECSPATRSAVEVLLSFEGWEQLRGDQKLSQKAARKVQTDAVLELLAD